MKPTLVTMILLAATLAAVPSAHAARDRAIAAIREVLLATSPDDDDRWLDDDEAGGRGGIRGEAAALMSPRRLPEAIEILNAFDPDAADQLRQLVRQDPTRARELLRPHIGRIVRLAIIRRFDPDLFDMRARDFRLENRTRDLATTYREARRADNAERAEQLAEELRDAIGEHIATRIAIRRHELERLERRIKDLREELQRREQARDELVNQRFDELTDGQ